MLFDAEQRQADWFSDQPFDVCICGAGPAGITLARALAAKGCRVALMEGGGLDPSSDSQAIYRGKIVGHAYFDLDTSRLRYFGGTSNHWEGYARALDGRDFNAVSYHPMQEWPISRSDLDPYAEQTAEILDLPEDRVPFDIFAGKEDGFKPITYRMSPPTRFGRKYSDELKRSDLVFACVNANLIDIELEDSLKSVAQLIFRSYACEEPFIIRARYYVLCCGGLENARILLNANQQLPQGIGNAHDVVGRFFSEHISVDVGSAIMASVPDQTLFYAPSDRLIAELKCLPFQLQIDPVPDRSCNTSFTERLEQALFGPAPTCFDAIVGIMAEQAMNPDSRLKLADEKDRFGLRRSALEWRLQELDLHTIRAAALAMARCFARHDVGRMRLTRSLTEANLADQVVGNFHQMCTTRMSRDPNSGVVDPNCQVHGIENLCVGGSSVFASGGVSNPTYTIVQLALRLADYLNGKLKTQ